MQAIYLLLIIASINILCVQSQACSTPQSWSVITTLENVYPIPPVVTQLQTSFPIEQIIIDDSTLVTLIDDIQVQPVVGTAFLPLYDYYTNFPTEFFITFRVTNNGNPVCLGTGYIAASDYGVQFLMGKTIEDWTIDNIKYDTTNAVSKVSITKYSTIYSSFVDILNQKVPSQINQYLKTPEYLALLNTNIAAWTASFYAKIYNYSYKNINGIVQQIQYNTTTISSQIDSNRKLQQRNLSIIDGTNICENTMISPPLTMDDKIITYAGAISFAQIQASFNYALKQGFFNTKLDKTWNCDIFQFYAANAGNVLGNIRGVFASSEIVTGQCTASSKATLALNGTQMFNALIPYNCLIYGIGSTVQEMAKVDFTLNLIIFPSMVIGEEQLTLTVKSLTADNVLISGTETNPLTNDALAQVYLQQTLKYNFINKEVIGSGFKTLKSVTQPQTIIIGQDVVFYTTELFLSSNQQ